MDETPSTAIEWIAAFVVWNHWNQNVFLQNAYWGGERRASGSSQAPFGYVDTAVPDWLPLFASQAYPDMLELEENVARFQRLELQAATIRWGI